MASETNETREKSLNFLEEIIEESIAKGETRVQTRFPPEPNGLLCISGTPRASHQLRPGEEIRRTMQPALSTTRTPS